MNPEHFTDKTNELIGKARELALDSAHVQITPVHLALALISDAEGLAVQIFKKAGADISLAERGLRKIFVRYAITSPLQIFLQFLSSISPITPLTLFLEFQYKNHPQQMSVLAKLLCKCSDMHNKFRKTR